MSRRRQADEADEVADDSELEAQFARLRADLVLRGHTLVRTRAGAFVASRQGVARHCPDVEALRAFAAALGIGP